MLIANKAFPYAGRRIAADESFEARTPSDASLLVKIKHARVAQPLEQDQGGTSGEGGDEKPRKGRKGAYLRRDMVAETNPSADVDVPTITGDAEPPEHLTQTTREI